MAPELWPHQAEAIDFSRNLSGAMLAMEVGTGKTRTGFEWIKAKGLGRVLAITPRKGLKVWAKEARKFGGDIPPIVELAGTADQQILQLYNHQGPGVFVTTFGISNRGKFKRMLMEKFEKTGLEGAVLDESHNIKAAGSSLAQDWGYYARRFPHRLAMTGTVLADKPVDAYGQYRYVDRSIFGTNFAEFGAEYVIYGGFENRQILGYKNLDRFVEQQKKVTYWAYADEVLSLPEGLDITMEYDMSPKLRAMYNEFKKENVLALGNSRFVKAGSTITNLLRLQQMTSGFVNDTDGNIMELDTGKQELLAELLESMGHEKVVVYCLFLHDLDFVRSITERLGRRYGEISGRRDDTVDASYPPDVSVMGVQIHSGSAAVDLTASSVGIFYSLGYSLTDYRQARGRIRRPGQTTSQRFIHLCAARSVDVRVMNILAKKINVIDELRRMVRGGEDLDEEVT